MKCLHAILGLLLIETPVAQASAQSIIFQCTTTSGEQSQWMLGPGEVRWNYGEGWSDNRCGPNDRCYFNDHGIYMGNSAVEPGTDDAWDIMYSPSDGELIYEDDAGGTTTFCRPS